MLFSASVANRHSEQTVRHDPQKQRESRTDARIDRLVRLLQAEPALLDDAPARIQRLEALLEQFAHSVQEDIRRRGQPGRPAYSESDLQQLFSFAVFYWHFHANLDRDDWEKQALAQWKLIHACGLHTVSCELGE